MPNLALLALEASDGTVVLTSITLVFAMLVAPVSYTHLAKGQDTFPTKQSEKGWQGKAAGQACPAPIVRRRFPKTKKPLLAQRLFCFYTATRGGQESAVLLFVQTIQQIPDAEHVLHAKGAVVLAVTGAAFAGAFLPQLAAVVGADAVSYTHLDVYKRQV